MRSVLMLVAGVLLLQGTMASMGIEIVPKDPNYPDQCVSTYHPEPHRIGSSWLEPGECARYTCVAVGEEYHIDIMGCGTVSSDDPRCKRVDYTSKPYPHCCPHYQCAEPTERPGEEPRSTWIEPSLL